MHAPSPLSCPKHCVRPEQYSALAELRDTIHRATAGALSRHEQAERRGFAEGVWVSEAPFSGWGALVWPPAPGR